MAPRRLHGVETVVSLPCGDRGSPKRRRSGDAVVTKGRYRITAGTGSQPEKLAGAAETHVEIEAEEGEIKLEIHPKGWSNSRSVQNST